MFAPRLRRTHLVTLGALAASFLAASTTPARAQDDIETIWLARFSSMKGNTSCTYGAADCNRCVHNVTTQFKRMTQDGAMERRAADWTFQPGEFYAPKGGLAGNTFDYVDVTAQDLFVDDAVFNGLDVHDFGHFQSFARIPTTADGQIGYITAFDGKNGAMFGITTDLVNENVVSSGRVRNAQLSYMDSARTVHIGGMSGIGRKAVVAQELPAGGPVTFSFYDFVSNAGQVVHKNLPLFPADPPLFKGQKGAANVAVAKLAGGGYVLVSSLGSYHQKYGFYYTPSLNNPALEQMYAKPVDFPSVCPDANKPAACNGARDGFENISIVTECGTGDLYMIGSTGPDLFAGLAVQSALFPTVDAGYATSRGTWALYKLTSSPSLMATSPNVPEVNTQDMDRASCDPRASGSAFAGKNGELAFYCTTIGKASALREAACVVSTSLPAVGGLLSGIINGLSALTGGLVPPFGDVIAGTLTASTPFLAGLNCGGATLDSLGLTNDSRWATAFTEFWPTDRTYEAPVTQTYPLTVTLTATNMKDKYINVREPAWNHSCELAPTTASTVTKTCTFNLPADGGVALVGGGSDVIPYWYSGGLCDSVNASGRVGICTFKMDGPKSVTFNVNDIVIL